MSRSSSFSRALVGLTFTSVLASGCGDFGSTKPTPVVTVTSIQPSSVPAGTPTEVRIEGWNFKEGAVVTIGEAATNVSVLNRTTIVATTSVLVEGAADVVVRNPDGGRGKLAGAFTFTGAAAVTISKVSPSVVRAGHSVTITGTGIRSGATVHFAGVPASSTSFSSGFLTARVPMLQGGPVDVTVTNPSGGLAISPAAITYMTTTLNASATSIEPGGSLTISWQAGLHESNWWDYSDWIGLFKPNVPNGFDGATTPWFDFAWEANGTYTLTAPMTPGSYEFRYVSSSGVTQAVVPLNVIAPGATSGIRR